MITKPLVTTSRMPQYCHARNLRIVLALLFGTSVWLPQLYQPLLTTTWTWLCHSSIYRSSTFETFWTVFCYAAIEPWITVMFLRHPEWRFAAQRRPADKEDEPLRRPRGMRRPTRRILEGVTYMAPLLLLDLTMIKKFADVPLEAMLASGNYEPTLVQHNRCVGNTCHTYFMMPSVHNFTLSSPLQTHRALPLQPPTSRRLALELVASLLIYDAAFFAFHLVMHTVPVLRTWHVPHHDQREIHPQVTNQLHVVERLGLVLLANFALNVIRSHVLTRTLFVPVFVWLLVEIHSGLDLPWGYEKVLPAGWGGGARKHARHHADGTGGLEPYFDWCDRGLERLVGRSRKRTY